ncbi:MAG: helix-turn-helix transcriptional regulator [Nitrospirae bacterium]|nr:helix-turn-helix transcriptional regulator [Nitrospirota bacterium]
MDNIQKELGKTIRTLRKIKALTQEELGEKAGLSYKFIGEIERGEVNPSLNSLAGIAKALNVAVRDLFPQKADILSRISPSDLKTIKKSLKLLSRAFSRV